MWNLPLDKFASWQKACNVTNGGDSVTLTVSGAGADRLDGGLCASFGVF